MNDTTQVMAHLDTIEAHLFSHVRGFSMPVDAPEVERMMSLYWATQLGLIGDAEAARLEAGYR